MSTFLYFDLDLHFHGHLLQELDGQANLQDFANSYGLFRLCVCVCLCVFVTIVRTSHTLAKIKNAKNYVCRFWNLPSKGKIVKIVLRDNDLLFADQTFFIFISLRW